MNISTEVQNLPERNVAFVSNTGDYRGNTKLFEGLFGKLMGWAGPKGLLKPDVVMLAAYYGDPKTTPPEELVVEVCMTVPEGTEVEGEVQTKVLPGGQYVVASAELEGPQEYGAAWESAMKWATENGHKFDMLRPPYEIYKNNPQDHPEGHHIVDICIAVEG